MKIQNSILDLSKSTLILVKLVSLLTTFHSFLSNTANSPRLEVCRWVFASLSWLGVAEVEPQTVQYLANQCSGLHTHLLDVSAIEVGMIHIDQSQLHSDELANQLDRLLSLPSVDGKEQEQRMDDRLDHTEESLLEQRTCREDGKINKLEISAQLFFNQTSAILTMNQEMLEEPPIGIECENALLC